MSDILTELRDAIEQRGRHAVIGTVQVTNADSLTCDVVLENEKIVRGNVPLRIFNDDGGFGVAFMPKVGSEVLVAFVEGKESRPQVIKVQEWDWMVMRRNGMEIVISPDNAVSLKRESGFEFTLTADDKYMMGNSPSHSILHGDRFIPLHNQHTHNTPNGVCSWPIYQIQPEDCTSDIFKVE